ncbi:MULTISPECIES: GNAT family N-acetyltransferase [unclassified Thioalkalivibrio]|uniref:GNAT family N-acetyltransferase n=1 Tax=unclassified Thioalkalivibrio TaxID=2621013 RepID=UPI000373ECC3|nr:MULTISPECIES: GNAT family N-acetyltransferase [unclassified Thioalkalivibrio]
MNGAVAAPAEPPALPLARQTVYLPFRFGYRTLAEPVRTMQVLQLPFTHIRPEHAEQVLAAAPDEDCLIRSMPVEAPLPRVSRFRGRLRFVPRQYQRHFIDLTTGWEAYQSRFSSKSRSSMRRKVRKLAEASDGTVDWRQYDTPEGIQEFHRLAREVSARTYQERLLDAGLPGGKGFVKQLLERAREGRVRGYLLFLDGQPIAYLYCPIDDGILRYAFLGYLQEYSDLSPGTVLQWLVLEALFLEGRFALFDFSPGEGAHKSLFGKDSRYCADVYLLRPSWRNRALVYSHLAVTDLSRFASAVLSRLRLKGRAKRRARATATG